MKDIWGNIVYYWDDFWFKFIQTMPWHQVPLGGGMPGYKKFRWQRLFNILIIIAVILTIIKIFNL